MNITNPSKRIAYALLIVLAFLAHGNTLGNGFVYDDRDLLVVNPNLEAGAFWQNLDWNERPVRTISLRLDHMIWDMNPFGYHLSNLILHILCVILVFESGRRILRHDRAAFLGALVFAVHPVLTESVASVANRKEMLAAACVFGALLASSVQTVRNSLLSAVLFGIGLFAKASAATYPLVLATRDGLTNPKCLRSVARYLPLVLMLAFFVFLKKGPLRNFSKQSDKGRSYYQVYNPVSRKEAAYGQVLNNALLGHGKAVSAFFVPVGLSVEHTLPENRSAFSASGLLGVGGLALFAFLFVRFRKSHPGVAFWAAFALITPLPTSNLVPVTFYYAERYQYLPYAGWCLLLGTGAAHLLERAGRRSVRSRSVAIAFLALVLIAAGLSARRNLDWKDNDTLIARTLAVYPKAPKTSLHLAKTKAKEEKYEEAIPLFRNVLSEYPASPFARAELAKSFQALGMRDSAAFHFERALEIRPGWGSLKSDLGVLYCEQGRYEEGIALFLACLEKEPDHGEALYNIALAYLMVNEPENAARHLEEALRLSPRDPAIRAPLGQACLLADRPERARAVCLEAIAFDESDFESRWILARAHLALGDSTSYREQLQNLVARSDTPEPMRKRAAALVQGSVRR